MAKKKFYKTPKGKLFYLKYIKDFNPYNPSDKLLNVLDTRTVSKSSYITPDLRGKKFSEITIENAEYIAYKAKMGTEDSRILAELKYFIELTKDDELTKDEVMSLLIDDEVGLIIKVDPVVDDKVIKKPNVF